VHSSDFGCGNGNATPISLSLKHLTGLHAGRPAAGALCARPQAARAISRAVPRQVHKTCCAAAAGQRGGDYTKELNDAEKRWEGQVSPIPVSAGQKAKL